MIEIDNAVHDDHEVPGDEEWYGITKK
jgi:hypothetical protein